MSVAARRLLSVASALVLLVGVSALAGASASAKVVHEFRFSVDGETTPTGTRGFNYLGAVAIEQASGDVWIAEWETGVVYKLNAAGDYTGVEITGASVPQASLGLFKGESGVSGIAVDNSGGPNNGDLYVASPENGLVYKFDASGKLLTEINGSATLAGFFQPHGVAVDSSGNLYVADALKDLVYKFEASGKLSSEISSPEITDPATIAVDSTGDVYLTNFYGSTIKLEAGGGSSVLDAGATTAVAVNPENDHVYVAESSRIAEYDAAGNRLGEFGEEQLGRAVGIVIRRSTGEVYVSDYYHNLLRVYGPALVIADTTTELASNVQPTSATLNGTVNPDGVQVSSCKFEYGTTTAYEQVAACVPASVGAGTSPVPVSASITGLQPDTTYHFRVLATSANGTNYGADTTLTTTGPPRIDGVWAVNVASTSTTLEADVNPLWPIPAEYRLEYGTTSSYGTTLSGTLGGGSNDVLISYHRQELQPNTTYHYKLTVSNAYGVVESTDHTFVTQPAGGNELALPDGRVWELVSPPNKQFGLIRLTSQSEELASSDGGAVEFYVEGALGEDPVGYKGEESEALSVRGPDGWQTQNISLPQARPKDGSELVEKGGSYNIFSQDLSRAIVTAGIDTVLASGGVPGTPYLRNNETSTFTPLLTPANVPSGSNFAPKGNSTGLQIMGATPDLSHMLFTSGLALTPEAVLGSENSQINLYELGLSDGELQLVNILPNGSTTGSEVIYLAGQTTYGKSERAISDDGRFVAWTWGSAYTMTAGECASPIYYKGLYVRDMFAKETFKIGGGCAFFRTMSSNGERIFYTEDSELYEYNTGTHASTDLTVDHGAGEANAGVQPGASDISEDGSYVYFVAKGVLANGAVNGEDNLYLLHYGTGEWSTSYIATLSGEDEKTWYAQVDSILPQADLTQVASRVSPDGRYFAFMSERSLTGYDNIDAVSGKPDEEVYLYDAPEHRTVCASCDPTGARPIGISDNPAPLVDPGSIWTETDEKRPAHWLAGNLPTWRLGPYQPRYLSNNGRLFFDSHEALVPQDTNGLEDPYEYEPVGVGDCTSGNVTFSERSDGCVNLISSGTSSSESVFLDASENGDDAFFITAGRLTSSDYDTAYDIYDAHVCSEAVPCFSAPVPSPPCTSGDSCKAAPSPQPEIFGPTPSATFSGIGNVIEEAKPAVAPRSLTGAQKLARALDACHKDKHKSRRDACERRARKRYPVKHPKVQAGKKGGSR